MISTVPRLIKTAEPFFFPGGPTGCLLVHGFTGTPKEMRWLGEYLRDMGHTVLGIRLAGHATQPEDMIRVRWQDWLADTEAGWHLLNCCTERVFAIGLSLGGLLALILASYQPVAGVVALATPHHPPKDPRLPFIKPISLLRRFKSKGPPRWRDAAAAVDHVSYSSDPTRAYAEARDLMAIMRQSLPQITAPVLLIYSKDDPTITSDEGHAEQILEGIGSREKELVWVENSGHVILRDAARELAFHAIGDFIQKVTKGQA